MDDIIGKVVAYTIYAKEKTYGKLNKDEKASVKKSVKHYFGKIFKE